MGKKDILHFVSSVHWLVPHLATFSTCPRSKFPKRVKSARPTTYDSQRSVRVIFRRTIYACFLMRWLCQDIESRQAHNWGFNPNHRKCPLDLESDDLTARPPGNYRLSEFEGRRRDVLFKYSYVWFCLQFERIWLNIILESDNSLMVHSRCSAENHQCSWKSRGSSKPLFYEEGIVKNKIRHVYTQRLMYVKIKLPSHVKIAVNRVQK